MNHRQLLLTLAIPCLCLVANPAAARMYQWLNPDTGTTQLSGTPPSWYRGENTGPRVYVIENGQVIDDTAIEVSNRARRKLRDEAFLLANKLTTEEKERQARLRAAIDREDEQQAQSTEQQLAMPTTETGAPAEASVEVIESTVPVAEPEQTEDPAIRAMKALIANWESRRTERARQTLQGSDQ